MMNGRPLVSAAAAIVGGPSLRNRLLSWSLLCCCPQQLVKRRHGRPVNTDGSGRVYKVHKRRSEMGQILPKPG
jgi:hypothetical protein